MRLTPLLVLLVLLVGTSSAWRRRRRRRRAPSPVNCAVSNWSGWGTCSRSCATGSQSRTRGITRHPAHGGSGCGALSQSRSCNRHKCPIHCRWGNWGPWSDCTSCFPGGRSRSRNVTVAAMFGGNSCSGLAVSTDHSCTAADHCPFAIQCPSRMYSCSDELTCIQPRLRCNGDDDCTDFSDEHECPAIRKPCGSTSIREIPYIDIAGLGYDITLGEEIGTILDNRQYGGRCGRVRSGEHNQLFRKPANMQSFRFQSRVQTTVSAVSYESAKSFYESEKGEMERKLQGSASFSFGNIFSLSGGATKTRNSKTLRIIERGTSSDVKYFRVFSNIVLSRFRTIRRSFKLSHSFRQRLLELPQHYDYAKYSELITDYGTHFYSSGVLGGRYEFVYRFSKAELRESGLSDEEQRNCLKTEASFKIFKLGSSGGSNRCTNNVLSRRHNGSFTMAAKEVISNVIGGQSHTASALSFFARNRLTTNAYENWTASVKLSPAVIDFKLRPISSVIPDRAKQRNMALAIEHYFAKYQTSKCTGRCENSGRSVVVRDGTICKCLCAPGRSGSSCEN
nr:complement component C6 [Ciona intestinalis]|eukprot:XP_002130788.3 complement component C6 [Ciona intestinalis]